MPVAHRFVLTVCHPGNSCEIDSFGDALDAARALLFRSPHAWHRLSVADQRCA